MPSGKTHLKIEIATLGAIGIIAGGANTFFVFADWEDELDKIYRDP